ncbi:alpha/beta hydrolase-fold protein [Steroidobacter sp.]|uniref:alpha/beta hydrolase-fold protein n=1 Tax=Steroidobacter sp. TaxID=1978227 RepID=UPI001A5ABBE8|nr:alpha/beta hydrolase-fold protein [Steroidobacter sp.]MBL8271403.1 DUF3327 domain-containing protein [Steroidobacter sp.]
MNALRAAIQASAAGESEAALAAFWKEIDAAGTPLIEPVAEDGASMWVTFLWRDMDKRDALNVGVSNLFIESGEKTSPLSRLDSTDVWFRTYKMNAAARFTYRLTQPEGKAADPTAAYREPLGGIVYEFFADPRARVNMPDKVSYAEGPRAIAEPWLAVRDDVTPGRIDILKADSKFLGNSRDVAVYTPAGYWRSGAAYPYAVIFDKEDTEKYVPTLFDNMIADGVIPPMVLVLVSYLDIAHRSAELPYNPNFGNFIAKELVPLVRSRYHISRDPKKAVISGCSFGGIGSTSVAYAHSDVFGNVLSQSGSYWWRPTPDGSGRSEREEYVKNLGWMPRKFVTAKKLPLRFYLDLGTEEGSGLTQANRQFRDILQARGYSVTYREHVGTHCSVGARSMLPIGLITLLGTEQGRRAIETTP